MYRSNIVLAPPKTLFISLGKGLFTAKTTYPQFIYLSHMNLYLLTCALNSPRHTRPTLQCTIRVSVGEPQQPRARF